MKVVLLSHTARTDVFRVGSHHLARELARAGHDVTHVSTPVTPGHLVRVRERDVRRRLALAVMPARDEPGVTHRVAVAATPLGGRTAGLGRRTCGPLLAAAVRRGGAPDVALVDQPLFGDVLDRLGPRTVVYRPTDVHPDGPLHDAERDLVRRADGVVATSEVVRSSLGPAVHDVPSIVLENGVELARFAAPGAPAGDGAVYVGALDDRFDWDALTTMARALPGMRFRLAGPVGAAVPAVPSNVELLGGVPYEDVPALLRTSAIGLLPLRDVPLNHSRSPMKYYEYLAAGLWVLARRTPTLAARDAPGVALYDDPAEAGTLLGRLAARPGRNTAGPDAAQPYDWAARADRLVAFLREVGAPG